MFYWGFLLFFVLFGLLYLHTSVFVLMLIRALICKYMLARQTHKCSVARFGIQTTRHAPDRMRALRTMSLPVSCGVFGVTARSLHCILVRCTPSLTSIIIYMSLYYNYSCTRSHRHPWSCPQAKGTAPGWFVSHRRWPEVRRQALRSGK